MLTILLDNYYLFISNW